jgi:L-alanine-DL-glutamate epimerase-like enolase superfamily enzyme
VRVGGLGHEGVRRNVELVRTVVDAVGADVDMMADAYMRWDAGCAVRCIRALEDAGLRLRWVEEALIPDDSARLGVTPERSCSSRWRRDAGYQSPTLPSA